MKFKLSANTAILVGLLSACSSAPPTRPSPETEPDKVISRIDDLSSRPAWVKESEPFRIESGMVLVLGQTTIPADHRIEAAYRIAENNAKGLLAGTIEQRLEFIFQNAEDGTSMDGTQAQFIGAEASKLTVSAMKPAHRYWEKVATTTDVGQRTTRYVVFSAIEIPETDFRKAILDAARRAQGKGGLSQDFSKKVDAHWDQFVKGN